jgi:hypothetical protein
MVAEALADIGDEDAQPVIEKLSAFEPAEAHAIAARLRYRQGRMMEATAEADVALHAYRTDPWPRLEVMRWLVTDLAPEVARDRDLGAHMLDALSEHFAVYMIDDDRREARLKLVQRLDFRKQCAAAFAAFEPHTPWRRDFLLSRRECYSLVGHPRLDVAAREVDRFLAEEPPAFGAGLTTEGKAP